MPLMTDSLARMELLSLIEHKAPFTPEQLERLQELLPQSLHTSLDKLKFIEMTLPLRNRKFFNGLQGDYIIIDEHGREVWASAWCHSAYIQTCPRMLKRRRS